MSNCQREVTPVFPSDQKDWKCYFRLIMHGGWDDFRTLRWLDSAEKPEMMLSESRELLQITQSVSSVWIRFHCFAKPSRHVPTRMADPKTDRLGYPALLVVFNAETFAHFSWGHSGSSTFFRKEEDR